MPMGLWGTASETGLQLDGGPWSLLLPILISLPVIALVFHFRSQLSGMSRRQWAGVIGLAGAAILLGRLFPLNIPWSDPFLTDQPVTATLAPFAAVPYLLAGAVLNVPAAILVGVCGGLARAVGQTNALVDIAGMGLVAGVAALLMQQNYSGRFYGLLRRPPVAGGLAQPFLGLLAGLHVLTSMSPVSGVLAALDVGLYVTFAAIWPLMIEGAIGGGIVILLLWIAPHLRLDRGTVPSPFKRSLQGQIVGNFLAFAAIVILLTTLVAFHLTTRSMSRAALEQMTANVDAAAIRLGALQSNLSLALSAYSADEELASIDALGNRGAVSRLQRAMPQFSRVLLVSDTGTVTTASKSNAQPHPAELQVAQAVFGENQSRFVTTEIDGETTVLLAVAVPQDKVGSVLIGQLAPHVLADIGGLLPGSAGPGDSLILDEHSTIVLGSGNEQHWKSGGSWTLPLPEQLKPIATEGASGQTVYQMQDEITGARQYLYYVSVPGTGWKIIATLPHSAILRQTLGIMGPVAMLLIAISLAFFLSVSAFGRNISRPLADVANASKAIAGGGGLERPVRSHRDDEIGQLSMAFSQMQRALKQRLDELSLLLGVSNQVSATVNLADGMKAVLQGILRGTGAMGARAIVRNPIAPASLVYAEGPGAEGIAFLDRMIITALREEPELILASSREIEERFQLNASPISAIFAVALRSAGEYQGALYVGYRQPHYFDSAELGLLRTLAGQAAVLVQNAYLFSAAEGGRRRLAAILASTTNAVLVTDQTDRVLLLNPAMERILGLKADTLIGQPVIDVIPVADLARRLSLGHSATVRGEEDADGKLELEIDARTYLANVATVHGSDESALGRVTVMQDVTDFVELDRLKSEFLAGISHDLKSPLTYMQNYAGMLPGEEDPAIQQEYILKILAGIDRMSLLVNDLVEMAHIQAGIDLKFNPVQMSELLIDIAEEYASPALMQGVRLKVQLEEDLPLVLGDRALLRRAITNYVTNGLKHAPNSGTILVAAGKKNDEVIISVRDHGPGISYIDQNHMFEKFYRGQKAAGSTRGSGLGLAIVKSVADHHQGRAWCKSRLGQGSIFYLALPVTRSQADQPNSHQAN